MELAFDAPLIEFLLFVAVEVEVEFKLLIVPRTGDAEGDISDDGEEAAATADVDA
jgi:hypothetical protein